ncbi:MAG TPA: signal recognition particle-docking protein FtsY [Rhabdaerophilum sp.]|nr:signal recognition particle-docking protein FtsY [Rhabdaerophilum sp.]
MSSDKKQGGFFGRLFGRGKDEAPVETPVVPEPAAPSATAEPFASAPPMPAPPVAPAPKLSWWKRLSQGLGRTASQIGSGITAIFTTRKLDADTLQDLEDVLIQADLGVEVSSRIVEAIGKGRFDKQIAPEEIKAALAGEVEKVLAPVAQPLVLDAGTKPFVLLMVGVNGSGKTTTIGKLAAKFRDDGKSVMLAAGDTFRAAAIEQLKVWAERTGAGFVARAQGADAAGLAFDALTEARANGTDVLLVDTAGRLQNKQGLMDELAKIVRVMKKVDESAPHAVLLVLDATVGQNAISQVEAFRQIAGVTGLVMTKLDGTARGGILVALSEKFGLPVHFIGVGESVEDLEPFAAADFARAIAGLDR